MKTFHLHWRGDQNPELVFGRDIADAVTRAGYGGGALAALDYWEEVDPNAEVLS